MDINIIIGIIGVAITFIGLIYACKTFREDYVQKPSDEKQFLLAQFKANQTLARQTAEVLNKFIVYYSAFDKEVWQGQSITYKMYYDEMRKTYETGNLSEALYKKIEQQEMSSITIQSHIKSLEQQFEALNLVHQEFRIKTEHI